MKIFFSALTPCCFLLIGGSNAQTGAPSQNVRGGPTAQVIFDSGGLVNALSTNNRFQSAAARTNQALAVRVQYPADLAGQEIRVGSLDGAQVLGGTNKLSLTDDATATIQLRMGPAEGVYRFVLMCGEFRSLLSFYAFAPSKPITDPTLLSPPGGP